MRAASVKLILEVLESISEGFRVFLNFNKSKNVFYPPSSYSTLPFPSFNSHNPFYASMILKPAHLAITLKQI